jgi:threonine synthase
MRIELAACEQTILAEIADKRMKRKDVAQTYALAIRSSERIDWAKVNYAIMQRWSLSALKWIKEQAHSGKCFSETTKEPHP